MKGIVTELWLVSTVLLALAFGSWTKLTMGGLLTLAGAFFPTPGRWNKGADGSGTVKAGPVSVAIKGGVRFAVVVSGIVVLVSAAFEGIQNPEFAKTAKKLYLDKATKKFHLDRLIAEAAKQLHLEQRSDEAVQDVLKSDEL